MGAEDAIAGCDPCQSLALLAQEQAKTATPRLGSDDFVNGADAAPQGQEQAVQQEQAAQNTQVATADESAPIVSGQPVPTDQIIRQAMKDATTAVPESEAPEHADADELAAHLLGLALSALLSEQYSDGSTGTTDLYKVQQWQAERARRRTLVLPDTLSPTPVQVCAPPSLQSCSLPSLSSVGRRANDTWHRSAGRLSGDLAFTLT